MAENLNFRSAFNGFNREDVVHYIEYLNANHENQLKQLQADLAAAQKESALPRAEDFNLKEQLMQQEAIIGALNAEKDELVGRCAQLEATLAAGNGQKDALKDRCVQQEALVSSLHGENKALREKCAQLEAQLAACANQCNSTADAQLEAKLAAMTAERDVAQSVKAQLEARIAALSAEKDVIVATNAQLETKLAMAVAEKDIAIGAKSQLSSCAEEELAAYRRAERVEREANERANAIYRHLHNALQDTAAKTEGAVTNLDGITDQVTAQFNSLRDALFASKSYMEQSLASLEEIRPIKIVE